MQLLEDNHTETKSLHKSVLGTFLHFWMQNSFRK